MGLARGFLFAVLALVFGIGFIVIYALGHTDAEVGQLSIPLIVGGSLVAAALCAFGRPVADAVRNRRQASKRLGQLTDEIRNYVNALERRRTFPPVALSGLHLERGEFAIRHDRVTLAEVRPARVGAGLGTRVRVGGFRIYLGGWKNAPTDELREVGTGEFVLTNRRLLFLGARTLSIPFDRLLTCRQKDAALIISENQHKNPYVFVLEMAGIWCFLVNWAADSRFESPRLPDGMHLSVTGEAPELHIQIRTGDE